MQVQMKQRLTHLFPTYRLARTLLHWPSLVNTTTSSSTALSRAL
jgi:hypothetical protein